jgi:hypothetical protein
MIMGWFSCFGQPGRACPRPLAILRDDADLLFVSSGSPAHLSVPFAYESLAYIGLPLCFWVLSATQGGNAGTGTLLKVVVFPRAPLSGGGLGPAWLLHSVAHIPKGVPFGHG